MQGFKSRPREQKVPEMRKLRSSASSLAKAYPEFSLYLIPNFVMVVTELSIVVKLALFVTFGAETFQKGLAVFLTKRVQYLILIAIMYGKLSELIILTRYSEQMRE